VIKALFETSGVRPGVDCAWELRDETRIKRAALSKKLIGFTAPILLERRRIGKCKARRFQPASSSSASNCCFRCRRADFLIARRSAATACFSAWRSRRVRLSIEVGKCAIFGRRAPTFRSLGFAYGSIEKSSSSCLPQKGQVTLQVEAQLKTAPQPGSISRTAIPSLRCLETTRFHSRYQTGQTPCCVFLVELRR
jgi:hypothetical protein